MIRSDQGVIHVPGCSHPDGVTLCGLDRARARASLYEALLPAFVLEEDAALYCTQVEACAMVQSGGVYAEYVKIMWRVRYNLAHNGRFIIETVPVAKVCRLSNRRLQAENVHARRTAATAARVKSVLARAKLEAERATDMASSIVTEMAIKCRKCGTDKIHRMTVQRNAGDEGMKTQCMCAACGFKWEMAG
jgi:DNA-directed RNA polymerase subunit M/transcription elongation factor TFIIS